jgi:hypothetical protein
MQKQNNQRENDIDMREAELTRKADRKREKEQGRERGAVAVFSKNNQHQH